MLLARLAAQENRTALTRQKVIVNRPVKRLAVRIIHPILPHPGGEGGMLDVQQEYAARLQRSCHVCEHPIDICHIVQRQP